MRSLWSTPGFVFLCFSLLFVDNGRLTGCLRRSRSSFAHPLAQRMGERRSVRRWYPGGAFVGEFGVKRSAGEVGTRGLLACRCLRPSSAKPVHIRLFGVTRAQSFVCRIKCRSKTNSKDASFGLTWSPHNYDAAVTSSRSSTVRTG